MDSPPPTTPSQVGVSAAISILVIGLIVGVSAAFMFLVTTFLFAFSGGQYRMVQVVGYGAVAVMATTLVLTAVAWKLRSPATAIKVAAIVTGAGWVAAVFGEWMVSFALGAG